MSKLFFIINQHLLDGSAHALYCFRHCWWLAKTRPGSEVHLVFPGDASPEQIKAQFGFAELENFKVAGLTAIRKPKQGRGVTLNFVFYWAAYSYLKEHAQPGDFLFSASFPKLFNFLAGKPALRQKLRFVYEVHQLALLDHGTVTDKARYEFQVIGKADLLITNSQPLADKIRENGIATKSQNAGLACTFSPAEFPLVNSKRTIATVGYLGSLYREQGVQWLVENWQRISNKRKLVLEIIGGSPADVERFNAIAEKSGVSASVRLRGAIAPAQIPSALSEIDALIIPALAEGRMPYVAITKAYDFLGMNRPVLASNIPSISEVMRPGIDALFFEPGDVESLAAAVETLFSNDDVAVGLRCNAAQRASELSWQSRSERIWQLLDSSFSGEKKAA
jgi:glycosyltransferase involved in cell wall biosynthesis